MLYTKYVDTVEENTKIKISIFFEKNTMIWATGRATNKGYHVSVTPVTIEIQGGYKIESFKAFSGFRTCLFPAERQSKKRLEEAIKIVDENTNKYVSHFAMDIKLKKEEL